MKYRKKPVEVEVFRLRYDITPEWFVEACKLGGTVSIDCPVYKWKEVSADIKTLKGDHRANFGDYIIRGVKGELYPCKPDIFAMTYDEE